MSAEESLEVAVRSVTLRLNIANPRLRVWADRFEETEPELLDFIDALPEGCVLYDAGASIGHFSLYAAIQRSAHVFAFEPEAQNFGTLELNHYLNRGALIQPFSSFNVALSDHHGIGNIYTRKYGAGEHVKILDLPATRDTHEAFEPEHVQTVITIPLDELVFDYGLPHPHALKIDVDGAEVPLLRGAARTLELAALKTVFIELSDEALEESAILQSHGFRVAQRFPVVRLSGGVYPGLFNCIFIR